jgi:hypothetical protein
MRSEAANADLTARLRGLETHPQLRQRLLEVAGAAGIDAVESLVDGVAALAGRDGVIRVCAPGMRRIAVRASIADLPAKLHPRPARDLPEGWIGVDAWTTDVAAEEERELLVEVLRRTFAQR